MGRIFSIRKTTELFNSDSRTKVMEDINRSLEHIDDTDMIELCENVLEKHLKNKYVYILPIDFYTLAIRR